MVKPAGSFPSQPVADLVRRETHLRRHVCGPAGFENHFLFDMQRIVELLIGDEGMSVRVRRVANVVDDGVFVRVVECDERCDELDGVEEAAGWVGVAADDKNLSRADYGESIQDLPEMIVGLHHARRDMGRDRVAGCHECRSFVEGRLDSFRRASKSWRCAMPVRVPRLHARGSSLE